MAGQANAPYVPLQVNPGQEGSEFLSSSLVRYAVNSDGNHWMAIMNRLWKKLKSSDKYDAKLVRPQGFTNNTSSKKSSSSKSSSSKSSSAKSAKKASAGSGRKKRVASAVKDAVKPAANAAMEGLMGMPMEEYVALQEKRRKEHDEDRREKKEARETKRKFLEYMMSENPSSSSPAVVEKKRKISAEDVMQKKMNKIQKLVERGMLSEEQANSMKEKAMACFVEDFDDDDDE